MGQTARCNPPLFLCQLRKPSRSKFTHVHADIADLEPFLPRHYVQQVRTRIHIEQRVKLPPLERIPEHTWGCLLVVALRAKELHLADAASSARAHRFRQKAQIDGQRLAPIDTRSLVWATVQREADGASSVKLAAHVLACGFPNGVGVRDVPRLRFAFVHLHEERVCLASDSNDVERELDLRRRGAAEARLLSFGRCKRPVAAG